MKRLWCLTVVAAAAAVSISAGAICRTASAHRDISYQHSSQLQGLGLGTIQSVENFSRNLSKDLSKDQDEVTNLEAVDQSPSSADFELRRVLRNKGRLIEGLIRTSQRLQRYPELDRQDLIAQLNEVRTRWTALLFNRDLSLSFEQYQNQIAQLEAQEAELSRAFFSLSREFLGDNKHVTTEAIQTLLPSDSALIEIVRVESSNLYTAYVLTSQGPAYAVELGNADTLDSLAIAFRQAVSTPTSNPQSTSRQLYEQLIAPLRPLLTNKTHLLISPDSQLHLVPFAALLDAQDRYLVETYQITYLTSGRELLRETIRANDHLFASRLEEADAQRQAPVIFANPAYGDVSEMQEGASTGLVFSPLPNTAQEGDAIASLLPQANFLTQAQATEGALKSVQSPPILHIATHGVFLSDRVSAVAVLDNRSASIDIVPTEPLSPNAEPSAADNLKDFLLHSILAFSGVHGRNSQDGEDGVLTALEASGLNLDGTQLVVLSACDTAVGAVTSGEGLYGLRRAFSIAGAQSQLSSLWQVDDLGTSELMTLYYQNLIEKSQGRSESLRNAQLTLMKTGTYAHPYYWSSFIFSGDWRPIDSNSLKKN